MLCPFQSHNAFCYVISKLCAEVEQWVIQRDPVLTGLNHVVLVAYYTLIRCHSGLHIRNCPCMRRRRSAAAAMETGDAEYQLGETEECGVGSPDGRRSILSEIPAVCKQSPRGKINSL